MSNRTYTVHGPKKLVAGILDKNFQKKIGGAYADREEAVFLEKEVQWLGAAHMIYVAVLETIHSLYGGLMDYGYIRLVAQWLQKRDIRVVNEETILMAEKDILPAENYGQLLDKIKPLMPKQ